MKTMIEKALPMLGMLAVLAVIFAGIPDALAVGAAAPAGPVAPAAGATAALTEANSWMKLLYIFAFICFVVGLACFTPMLRQPGWGAAAIVVALMTASAPSCVSQRFQGANLILGSLDAPATHMVASVYPRPSLTAQA